MQDNAPLTIGVDHAGLAVKNLENARVSFCECLGWKLSREPELSASFVSDGWHRDALIEFGELRSVRPPSQCWLTPSCPQGCRRAALDALHRVSRRGPTP